MSRKKEKTMTADKITQIIDEAIGGEVVRMREQISSIRERCESPIEELLMVAIYSASLISEHDLIFCCSSTPNERDFGGQFVLVYQQAPVGPYRADILIHDASQPLDAHKPRWMVVECDGHAFHEKTKEQARRDKKRDRFFQSKGYKVLRFTGSEIWADPEACADEIIDELAANDIWRNRDQ